MGLIKNTLREILIGLHIDATKNLKYDRLTTNILKTKLKKDYNCIDVGCHKGEILDLMIKYAPNGNHYGFEPIPYLVKDLKTNYKDKAKIYSCALSDKEGETSFQLVKNAPAYSGIKKRRYDISNPDIEEITVDLKTLDNIIPSELDINLIKIDVEGGELGVLKGAKNLLLKSKPIIIFECGNGASDFYGTTPKQIFDYLVNDIGLGIYTLDAFIKKEPAMDLDKFTHYFITNQEYYFVASLYC